jgi:Tol biopolymer transport system component
LRNIPRRLLAFAAPLLGILAGLALLACGKQESPQLLLYFFSHSAPDRPGLYVVSGDGSGLRQVALLRNEELSSPPVPSPNAERLAFPCRSDQALTGPPTDVCLSTINGSDVRIATQGRLAPSSIISGQVAWSPDSRLLAFVTDLYNDQTSTAVGELYLLDAETEQVRLLLPGAPGMQRGAIAWSPDGGHLAVPSTPPPGSKTALEVVDVESGSRLDVAAQIEGLGSISDFAWSPDSSAIAFVRTVWRSPFPSGVEGTQLYSVAPDGSGLRLLPDLGDWPAKAVWSPDSRFLAVTARPVGGGFAHLYVVPLDGGDSGPLRLAPDLLISDFPAWSPDSSWVAFLGAESLPETSNYPTYALYIVSASGGGTQQLAQKVQPPPLITWSPDGQTLFYTADTGPCLQACTGPLFLVPSDGSVQPVQVTTFTVDAFLGWYPEER